MAKPDKKKAIADLAEADVETFIRLVHPNRVLGACHSELLRWVDRKDAKSHRLILMPRDHQKSALAAYIVAHRIVKNPAIRVLYISSTANLAIKQLKFIKDILASDTVRQYWPHLVKENEGQREKWTENEIAVDDPRRKFENVRDPTIFTAGLTTGITGMHADLVIMDDVVVRENADTEEGRSKVRSQYSLLSSIEAGEAEEIIVGTRYNPKDLYSEIVEMKVALFNDEGELISEDPLYETYERQVEDRGDGFGVFLWPRQRRQDGKWFGFNAEILAKKKAQYLDQTQFRAQYYNDPNDPDGGAIKAETFQYYEPKFLTRNAGQWYFKNKRLNIFAAVDFAYSLNRKADYTSIVVVGVDSDVNYYVLDIDRFKTDQIAEYFSHILRLHQKWDFRKIRAEVTAAQQVIVNDIKQNYIRPHGLALAVEDFRPNRTMGTKEERVNAILSTRYNNRQVWHFFGGYCQVLEEELVMSKPQHDDIKDCLASVVDIAIAPSHQRKSIPMDRTSGAINTRFGGIL